MRLLSLILGFLFICLFVIHAECRADERHSLNTVNRSALTQQGNAAPTTGAGLGGRSLTPSANETGRTVLPSIVPSLGNTGGKSTNPIGAEQKFKNDLQDARMRITSEGAKMDAKQASSGLGIGQTEEVTKADKKTVESLKEVKEKNNDIQSRKNYCEPRCKKISNGEDAGPSGIPAPGMGNYSSKVPSIKIKTEEEKEAEAAAKEQAEQEKKAYEALSQKEKFDICMKDCMKSAGAKWSNLMSKLGNN